MPRSETYKAQAESNLAVYRRKLDEINEEYCDAMADLNVRELGCPCGCGCCGDPEHCAPCVFGEAPMTYDEYARLTEDLATADRRSAEQNRRIAELERNLASHQEFLRLARQENKELRAKTVRPQTPADFEMGF